MISEAMFVGGGLLAAYGLATAITELDPEWRYLQDNYKKWRYVSAITSENFELGIAKEYGWVPEMLRVSNAVTYMTQHGKRNFGRKDKRSRKAYYQEIFKKVEANVDYYLSDWDDANMTRKMYDSNGKGDWQFTRRRQVEDDVKYMQGIRITVGGRSYSA